MGRPVSIRQGRGPAAVVAGLACLAVLTAATRPAGAAPIPVPTLDPARPVIAGPGAGVRSLGGVAVSHDGSGAAVYLAAHGGPAHVFVARMRDGVFAAGRELGARLPGAASQPTVAAGEHGIVLVAFVQNRRLYVAQTTRAGVALGAVGGVRVLARHAASPSLALSRTGEGYLAWTETGHQRDTVRFAHWHRGRWRRGAAPADGHGAPGAGTGGGRPVVAAPNDGIGVLAWGQGGHVEIRRLDHDRPSPEIQRADPDVVGGDAELGAADPVLADTGFSTFASLAFDERLQTALGPVTRVLYTRLDAARLDPPQPVDAGALGTPDGSDEATAAVNEFGLGLIGSQDATTHQLYAALLGTNGVMDAIVRVDSLANTADPYPVTAAAGLYGALIAWQQTPGTSGPAELRVRYAPDAATLGAETVVSDPADGPTDAALGLAAGSDGVGEGLLAWVQQSPAGPEIVAAELDQRPHPAVRVGHASAQHTSHPRLRWRPAIESWGPLTYSVTLDGATVAQTPATQLTVPQALSPGTYDWQVTATDPAGLVSPPLRARVVVARRRRHRHRRRRR